MFILGYCLAQKKSLQLGQGQTRYQPSREQLLSWIDQAPIGWLIIDRNNKIRFINTRAQRLLEFQVSSSSGSTLAEMRDITLLKDLVNNVRDHPQPQRLEWDYRQHELEVFAFAGQLGSVAILLQSRRSLEAQLIQQERWVSDVAHELKTPLTALLLVGDSLAGSVTDTNAVLVERLLKELRRMQDLVGDLLELSRLENVLPGRGIRSERIDILQLIKEVWQGLKPLADEKSITINLTFHPRQDRYNHSFYGDKARLYRAILNLLDNALHFSPDNSEIKVEIYQTSEWVRVRVRDQGAGLSEMDLDHMFDRFYRGDRSRFRQNRGGSGLGLAIVQQIALAHGGWVFGENDTGGGAMFELRLPSGA